MILRALFRAGGFLTVLVLAATPALAADPVAGKKKVSTTCAVCHGLNGIAKLPEAPHLAGENAQYIIKQLKAFKSGERKSPQMSIVAQGLSDEDMANVAAWFASLKISVELPE
jgi:cytochrome c553